MERRTALKSAAWSVPVIALAIAAPAAAASTNTEPIPVACTKIKHAGQGGHQWAVTYSDSTSKTMTNGDAMSGPHGELCRKAGANPGAGNGGEL